MDKLYTCEEVAARYSMKLTTIYDWIRNKTLGAVKVGRGYRVRESDLEAFEAKNLTRQ